MNEEDVLIELRDAACRADETAAREPPLGEAYEADIAAKMLVAMRAPVVRAVPAPNARVR